MKPLAGFLVLFLLHSALAAQQPDGPSTHCGLVESSTERRTAFSSLNNFSNTPYAEQAPPAGQKQKGKPAPKTQPSSRLKRTRIDASMVGYIEDSAVQTQVRVRFDAGFNAPRPDRAEYFMQEPAAQLIARLPFSARSISNSYIFMGSILQLHAFPPLSRFLFAGFSHFLFPARPGPPTYSVAAGSAMCRRG